MCAACKAPWDDTWLIGSQRWRRSQPGAALNTWSPDLPPGRGGQASPRQMHRAPASVALGVPTDRADEMIDELERLSHARSMCAAGMGCLVACRERRKHEARVLATDAADQGSGNFLFERRPPGDVQSLTS